MAKLKDKIETDFKKALKEKNIELISTLRLLKSAVYNLEIEKRTELKEEELTELIQKEVKKRRDSIAEFKRGGRQDLAQKEEAEIKTLSAYLPEPIKEDEIEILIEDAIKKTGAKTKQDAGKVMGNLMPALKGKVDGLELHNKVLEKLSEKTT